MKKIILIMIGLFVSISCSKTDDHSIQTDDNINEPLPPNRGINMNLSLKVKFINNSGENIFEIEPLLFDANEIDVDVFGVNSYLNEYPYSPSYSYRKYITFINYEGIGKCFKLNGYGYKSQEIQQAFGERGWLKYKITFPDDVVYEVKVEGALIPNSTIDYYPTKIFVNDELKWQQPQGSNSGYMDITIVK